MEPTAENDAPRYWWTLTIYASQHVTGMSGPGHPVCVIPPGEGASCAVVGCADEGLWWSAADEVWFCEPHAVANMPSVIPPDGGVV